MSKLDFAIVGAGPYGISLGLHLKAKGKSFKVFGPPMNTWRGTMPKGMDLKSEGYASTISDPSGLTLQSYCGDRGIPYKHVSLPVPLDVFNAYGMDCYSRLTEFADERLVSSIASDGSGFRLVLEDGEEISCGKVIVAVGISHYAYLPDQFDRSISSAISHSSEHSTLDHLKGKEVVVIGAGASAIDLAVLAAEAGSAVTLVCRGEIAWNVKRSDPRPLYERIRLPESCMGPGVRSCLYEKSPLGFKTLPSSLRDKIAKEFAGPAGGWNMRERFERAVPHLAATRVTNIEDHDGQVDVTVEAESGEVKVLRADHLICATGYKTDVNRLTMIDDKLRSKLAHFRGSPVLDSNYESTVPGMYFVGKSSAVTFGPLMRFVCGTSYASKRLSRHLINQV